MRKGILKKKITFGLSYIQTLIVNLNSTGRTDENLDLEDFFCEYLNICNHTSLTNLNKEKKNYPGVDLGDKAEKVSFQVTSDGKRSKVVKTIEKFESHSLYKEFEQLNILIVGNKPNYSKPFETNGRYSIDNESNIVGIKELIDGLESLDDNQLELLVSLFEREYPGIFETFNSRANIKIDVTAEEGEYPEFEAPIKLKNNGYPLQAIELLTEIEKAEFKQRDDEFKYKLLANIGLCYLDLINNDEAAKYFIKAQKYNPHSDKALGFAAIGKLLQGKEDKAEKLALKAIKINPKSELAYNTLINLWTGSKDFEKKLKGLPKSIRKRPNILYQLGKRYQELGDYKESRKYHQKAIDKSKKPDADLKGSLGTLILENTLKPFLYVTGQIDESGKREIKIAVDLLKEAWKEAENSELKESRVAWLVSIATGKKALNDPDGALFDFKRASQIGRKDFFVQRQYAISLFENGDINGALEQLQVCRNLDENNDPMIDLFEAELYYKGAKYEQVLEILKNKTKEVDFEGKSEWFFLKIACFDKLGKPDLALKECEELIDQSINQIRALVVKSKLLKQSGDYEGFKSILDEALTLINESTSHENIHDVVSLLNSEERFHEQIDLLLRITNKNAYSELTKLLVSAYFNVGNYKDAIELITGLKEKVGLRDYLVDIESMIHFQIHDYPEAQRLCEEFLLIEPDHPFILMRLATILSKNNDIKELNRVVGKIQHVNSQTLRFRFQYASFLVQCDHTDRALHEAYEARRDNFTNGFAHLSFFQLFNEVDKKYGEMLVNLDKVYFDTTVFLNDESTNEVVIKTLLNIENPKHERGELGVNDSLTKELISMEKGEKVVFDGRTLLLQDIASKYVGAYRESIDLLDTKYQKISGFESFKLREIQEGQEVNFKEDLAPIYRRLEEDESFQKMIDDKYKAGALPIGSFAAFIKKNFIRTWIHLVNSNHLGIDHYGSDLERKKGVSLVQSKTTLVFTLSSLLSTYHVAKNEVALLSNQKIVAQSSLDIVDDLLQECRFGIDQGGHYVVIKSGEELFRQDITVEDLQRTHQHYTDFKTWCVKTFEVLPNKKETEMNQAEKEKEDQILGESFIDSAHIAQAMDAMIIDDDARFRYLIKQKFELDSIGIYMLADHWLKANLIDTERFFDIGFELANLNYKYIPCSRDFLLHVTNKVSFQLSFPLTDLLAEFGSEFFEMSASINILVLYLKEIYLQTNHMTMEKFADFIVQTVMRRRNYLSARNHFFNSLSVHFKLLDLQRLRIIEIWNQHEQLRGKV